MNLISIYNICGLGNKPPIENYIDSIESILQQNISEHVVVLSACMVDDSVKTILKEYFKNRITYNFIDEILPLNVTYNLTAKLCVNNFGLPLAFAYIDSGVTLLKEDDLYNLLFAMYDFPDCGMITSMATSDNGYHWLGFNEPSAGLYKIPVGRACHPHCHLFHQDIYKNYNECLWPDIFASFCTESIFTFMCSAIERNWYILKNVLVSHAHEMEGGSAGFRKEHSKVKICQGDGKGVWDHNFRSKKTMKEIISDPVGIAAGFGYEEIQNILIHDPDQFDENGWCKNKILKEFIKDNLYLKTEEFDYNKIFKKEKNNDRSN